MHDRQQITDLRRTQFVNLNAERAAHGYDSAVFVHALQNAADTDTTRLLESGVVSGLLQETRI